MNHKGTKRMETNRLLLRKFETHDAGAVFRNWASDDLVTKYLVWGPMEKEEDELEVLKSWISEYENQNFYQWAIVLKEYGDEPIGTISVVRQDESINMVHIGYCIGRKWWNKGITSEALSAIIDFFFKEVNANRIESRHDPKNPSSGKVMQKCGMSYEGTLRQADFNNQGICDASMYAILAQDYKKNDVI